MSKLVNHLDHGGLAEPDDGPWGSQIVLAAKPGQDDTPWCECIWHLCVSHRRVNQASRPFVFPVPRCDNAVNDLGPCAKCVISFDLDCGHWQVTLEEASRAKLAFFAPNGKRCWTVVPMGFLNSHAIFVAVMATMQAEWDQRAAARGLKNVRHKIIIDDVLSHAPTVEDLLTHFCIGHGPRVGATACDTPGTGFMWMQKLHQNCACMCIVVHAWTLCQIP